MQQVCRLALQNMKQKGKKRMKNNGGLHTITLIQQRSSYVFVTKEKYEQQEKRSFKSSSVVSYHNPFVVGRVVVLLSA